MKKYKLRKWVKHTILIIMNSIIIMNLPNILKDVNNSANNFRYNIFILAIIIIANVLIIRIIEKEN